MGIQPRKIKHEAEGRILWWLLLERDAARDTMASLNGKSFFDQDEAWCVIAKAKTGTCAPVCFGCVFAPDLGSETLDMYVWDDDPKPTLDDVREWFKSTVKRLAGQYGRPQRAERMRYAANIEGDIGEDGRRINPARDAREVADDLYLNSTAAKEQDAIASRAASASRRT